MSIGKRLITTGAGGVTPSCTTDTTDIFDDSSGIALYSLDYDASTAPDATTDYSGTASNVEFGTDGHINWGARFNGSGSKISLPSGSFQYTILSVSAWINVSNTSSTRTIIETYGYSGSSKGWLLRVISGKLQFDGYNGDPASTTLISNESIPLNTWTHVAVVFSANTKGELYINGSEVTYATQTVGTVGFISNEAVNIGALQGTNIAAQDYFIGSIDQVRIFNRALLTDNSGVNEIDTLYSETACVYTGTTQSHLFGCTANYNLDGDAKESMGVASYDGTESNITYEFGRFGTAAVLNGSSSLVTITDGGIGNNGTARVSFSVSLWIKTTASNQSAIISDFGTNYGFYIQMESSSSGGAGKLSIANYYSGGLNYRTAGTVAINDGNWHHLVLVNKTSDNTQKLYLDGNTTPAISHSLSTGTKTANAIQVGYYDGYVGTYNFDGNIDQIRLFSSAVTTTQVEGLFNDEKQAYITKSASDPFGDSSEVAFYKMENNSNDSTGSNNGSDTSMTYSTSDALFDSYSAVFDGSSSIITTSLNKSSYSSLSYSVWIKTSSTSQQRIIDASSGNSQNRQCLFTRFDGSKGIRYISIGDDFYDTGNLNTLLGDWFHVVVTDGGGDDVNLYINGELVTFTKVLSNGGYLNPSNTLFGAGRKTTNDIGNYFSGDLDQIRIFNRALEGDEVFKLYAEVIN